VTEETQTRFRAAAHVQLYFWIALLAVSILPALVIAVLVFGASVLEERLITFALLLGVFQGLFWFARNRCSTADLPAWDGLLHVATYMTIGIGSMSLLVAVPCVILAVLVVIGIALASLLDADATRERARFRRMVIWFGRHRMYQ
jgi:hypothetical protein